MRIRLDPSTSNHVSAHALAEGRSTSEMVRLMVNDYIHRYGPPTVNAEPRDSDNSSILSAHVPPAMSAAIRRLAADDDRSVSYMLKALLRDGLRSRGVILSYSRAATAPAGHAAP